MMSVSKNLRQYRELITAGAFMAAVVVCLVAAGCGSDSNPAEFVDARAFSTTVDQTVSLDSTPNIVLDNFVGDVTVTSSGTPLVHVTATKYASREEDLDKISFEMTRLGNDVTIVSSNPNNTEHVLVDLEITAPQTATWDLYTQVGSIEYDGRPSGMCSFLSDVGDIHLTWPSDLNADVNVSANVGTVLFLIPLEGMVSLNTVIGTIGIDTPTKAHIAVSTGVGSITIDN